jgi:hypothetical protein
VEDERKEGRGKRGKICERNARKRKENRERVIRTENRAKRQCNRE